MLYAAYQAQSDLMAPFRLASSIMADAIPHLPRSLSELPLVRRTAATAELVSLWGLTHERPAFGIESTVVDGETVAVRETNVLSTPFGTLVHFAKDDVGTQPRVLVVAGLAGHFATLLRGTVRTLLPDHDVYITDWHNARDVSPEHGRFGLDEYVEHLIDFLAAIGPGAHLMAVCQPCVPALAAATIMAEDEHPSEPRSLILMAGPVDARTNPGRLNRVSERNSIGRLERHGDHHRAPSAPRGRPPRLPGLHPGRWVHGPRPTPARGRVPGLFGDIASRRARKPCRRRSSTRSTSPSSTSPPSTTSKPCGRSSRPRHGQRALPLA